MRQGKPRQKSPFSTPSSRSGCSHLSRCAPSNSSARFQSAVPTALRPEFFSSHVDSIWHRMNSARSPSPCSSGASRRRPGAAGRRRGRRRCGQRAPFGRRRTCAGRVVDRPRVCHRKVNPPLATGERYEGQIRTIRRLRIHFFAVAGTTSTVIAVMLAA